MYVIAFYNGEKIYYYNNTDAGTKDIKKAVHYESYLLAEVECEMLNDLLILDDAWVECIE